MLSDQRQHVIYTTFVYRCFPVCEQEMTGLELRPSDHGEKDMPGLLILLSRLGVLYLNISSTG